MPEFNLSKQEILAMPAGRRVDCLIAEFIESFHRETVGKDYYSKHGGTEVLVPKGSTLHSGFSALGDYLPRKGPIPLGFFVPEYSKDLKIAWHLFRGKYLTCQMIGYMVDDPDRNLDELNGEKPSDCTETGYGLIWMCTCYGKPVYAQTVELAICRAALLSRLKRKL